MHVLIGMEFSGAIRTALRKRGIDAWSCDRLDAADGSPHHLKCDVFKVLDQGWDAAVFHPSCTYLTSSAEWAYGDPDYVRYPHVGYHQKVKSGTLTGAARRAAREWAIIEFNALLNCAIPLKIIENPRGVISTRIRPPTQIVQPYQFGDDASKATCLWIAGMPPIPISPAKRFPGRKVLVDGRVVERWSNQTDSGQNNLRQADDRWAERSKTFPGIANAIAEHILCNLLFRG